MSGSRAGSSFVRSRATGKPYLDGARGTFDGATEDALKAFQREHESRRRRQVRAPQRGQAAQGGRAREAAAGAAGRRAGGRQRPSAGKPAPGGARAARPRVPRRARAAHRPQARRRARGPARVRARAAPSAQAADRAARRIPPRRCCREIVAILLRIEDDVEELKKAEEQERTAEPVAWPTRRAGRRGRDGDGRGARGGPAAAAAGRPRSPATVTQVGAAAGQRSRRATRRRA